MELKTSNPALSGNAFQVRDAAFGEGMTISGAVNKTGILVICVVATAAFSWNQYTRSPETALPFLLVGSIGGLIAAIVTIFKKAWSPVTAPIYALLEGLVLGSASSMINKIYPGIAIEAVGVTFGTLIALLLAYRAGIIRATEKFKLGVVAATGGGAESRAGFRFDRTRGAIGRAEVDGVVWRVCADGDADLAVLGDTAVAGEAESQKVGISGPQFEFSDWTRCIPERALPRTPPASRFLLAR